MKFESHIISHKDGRIFVDNVSMPVGYKSGWTYKMDKFTIWHNSSAIFKTPAESLIVTMERWAKDADVFYAHRLWIRNIVNHVIKNGTR